MIDPAKNSIVGEIPVGGEPAGIAVGRGSVWIGNEDKQTLLRVDPESGKVVDQIGLGVRPLVVAAGEEGV